MSESKIYPVPAEFAAQANITAAQYDEMYQQSVADPEGFWSEQAENYLSWFKPWNSVCDWSFAEDDLHIKWFEGAELNVSYNCLDRHLSARGDQVAIIWEADDPTEDRKITYAELHEEVCKFSNVLKAHGVNRGDRVSIYMPMIRKPRLQCWPVPALVQCIQSCSVDFLRTHYAIVSRIPIARS